MFVFGLQAASIVVHNKAGQMNYKLTIHLWLSLFSFAITKPGGAVAHVSAWICKRLDALVSVSTVSTFPCIFRWTPSTMTSLSVCLSCSVWQTWPVPQRPKPRSRVWIEKSNATQMNVLARKRVGQKNLSNNFNAAVMHRRPIFLFFCLQNH